MARTTHGPSSTMTPASSSSSTIGSDSTKDVMAHSRTLPLHPFLLCIPRSASLRISFAQLCPCCITQSLLLQPLEPLTKKLGVTTYTSLLKPQRGEFAPLVRTKVTISDTGKIQTRFFVEGIKRRLTDAEILDLDWRVLSTCSCVSPAAGCKVLPLVRSRLPMQLS